MIHGGTHPLTNNVNIHMALSQKYNKVTKNNVRFYNANACSLILLASMKKKLSLRNDIQTLQL